MLPNGRVLSSSSEPLAVHHLPNCRAKSQLTFSHTSSVPRSQSEGTGVRAGEGVWMWETLYDSEKCSSGNPGQFPTTQRTKSPTDGTKCGFQRAFGSVPLDRVIPSSETKPPAIESSIPDYPTHDYLCMTAQHERVRSLRICKYTTMVPEYQSLCPPATHQSDYPEGRRRSHGMV